MMNTTRLATRGKGSVTGLNCKPAEPRAGTCAVVRITPAYARATKGGIIRSETYAGTRNGGGCSREALMVTSPDASRKENHG